MDNLYTQKRTCNDCRALEKWKMQTTGLMTCELGFKTIPKSTFHGIVIEIKPIEPCPKPKTRIEFDILKEEKSKI